MILTTPKATPPIDLLQPILRIDPVAVSTARPGEPSDVEEHTKRGLRQLAKALDVSLIEPSCYSSAAAAAS